MKIFSARLAKLKGFTLIELLIVITIIGILIVALLPKIMGAPGKARDVARKADLNQIAVALEGYMSDEGEYPKLGPGDPPTATVNCLVADDADLKDYMGGSIPVDPSADLNKACGETTCKSYVYAVAADGVHYTLAAKLEGGKGGNAVAEDAAGVYGAEVEDNCTRASTHAVSMVDEGDRPYFVITK